MIRFTCRHCGLGGETCLLRFSKSPKPRYDYVKQIIGDRLVHWCVGVHPAPRAIMHPDKETCPDWRDVAGRSRERVEELLTQGKYTY